MLLLYPVDEEVLQVLPVRTVDPAIRIDARRLLARLTPPRREILWRLAMGETLEEISASLGLKRNAARRIAIEALRTARATARVHGGSLRLPGKVRRPS